MSWKMKFPIFILLIIGLLPVELGTCTTFCFKDKEGNIFFGRNFDFPTGIGAVHINQKGLGKTSAPLPNEKPFTWVSKYGSITFNQNGREFPYGGINEAGLVVEQMMLNETKYPANDNRYGLQELQWIQYQLDVAATVDDVIKSDSLVRISTGSLAPLHFSVADVHGNFAVIEYLNGKTVVHTGRDAVNNALANDTYETSLSHKAANDTKSRFVRATNMIEVYDKSKGNGVDYAFEILNNVAQGEWTRWSIVYDLKKRIIHYKTGANKNIRTIKMDDFDYSCSEKRLFTDIDENAVGVTDFKLFDCTVNYNLIDKAWRNIDFLKNLPPQVKKSLAEYPDQVKCKR